MGGTESARPRIQPAREGLISAISVGAVFILIGVIYINTPDLWGKIGDFLGSFTSTTVANTGLTLPAPQVPAAHAVLYGAVFQFSLGISILTILLLALRLLLHSPIGKTAETVGNLVFWLGASYLVTTYLNSATNISTWFVFWASVLMIGGLSLIARGFVLLAKRI
jgi:hypothetical protein